MPLIPDGIWASTYEYESTSRGPQADRREVKLSVSGTFVWVTSLPGDQSILEMGLDAAVRLVTGTWKERTDRSGPYAGEWFHGAAQFILAEDGQSMTGRWVGHSRDLSEVNTGTWTLTYVEPSPDGLPRTLPTRRNP